MHKSLKKKKNRNKKMQLIKRVAESTGQPAKLKLWSPFPAQEKKKHADHGADPRDPKRAQVADRESCIGGNVGVKLAYNLFLVFVLSNI